MQKKFITYLLFTAIISSCSKDLQSKSASQNDLNNQINQDSKNPNELVRQTIYFDTNSSKIALDKVKQIKNDIKSSVGKNTKITIVAEGHCDERGSEQYNYKLGKKRAHAVKKILVSSGIKPNKIAIVSYGENKPVDLGHDENAWSKNRRVELVIMK